MQSQALVARHGGLQHPVAVPSDREGRRTRRGHPLVLGQGEPRLLGAHHARRHGETQDVAGRPRAPVCEPPGEGPHTGRQHGHGRHDRLDRTQRPLETLSGIGELDEIAVRDAARRAQRDPHAHPGNRLSGELIGDGVVEEVIQLRERRVEDDAGDPAGRRHRYSPAADRRSSTRSSRSHVNSGSSRPKWPYVAVRA